MKRLLTLFLVILSLSLFAPAKAEIWPSGTLPEPTPAGLVAYLPIIERDYVRLIPTSAVLSAADVGAGYLLTGSGTEDGDYYRYSYVKWEDSGFVAASDVFVMNTLDEAKLDFADTVAFYESDPLLSRVGADVIGSESALFKGQALQFLWIFRKANSVVIIGTQNLSHQQTQGLAERVLAKF